MNLLGMIFSILLILSITLGTLLEKTKGKSLTRMHAISHSMANRNLLTQHESALFRDIHGVSKLRIQKTKSKKAPLPKKKPFPIENPPCARINIYPLYERGKEQEPFLYQLLTDIVKRFYMNSFLDGDPKKVTSFVDAFLQALFLQKKGDPLEKLSFSDPKMRKVFYHMVKGSKESNLFASVGTPPFLEYITFEFSEKKPCLRHAHPHLTAIFFGDKVALSLFEKNASIVTEELISQLAVENYQVSPRRAIFEFLDLKNPICSKKKEETFIAKESGDVLLKRTLPIHFKAS